MISGIAKKYIQPSTPMMRYAASSVSIIGRIRVASDLAKLADCQSITARASI
jgi:hypothetical protein